MNWICKKSESGSNEEYIDQLLKQSEQIQTEVNKVQASIEAKELELKSFYDKESEWKNSIAYEDKIFRELQITANSLRDSESTSQIEKAKLDTHQETVISEIGKSLNGEVQAQIEKEQIIITTPDLSNKIGKLKQQLNLIGGVDDLTLQEYHETEARYSDMINQVEDLRKSMADLRSVMDELDGHIRVQFSNAFHKVNIQFENYFRVLFNGGKAHLSLLKN